MKILKMAAVSLAALTLFASCKDEPKKEISQIRIRIADTELRALEAQIQDGHQATIEDVAISINNGVPTTLTEEALAAAKTADGYIMNVKSVVTSVSMTATGVIEDDDEITEFQGLGTEFKVPLTAETTDIQEEATETTITYVATLEPKPELARLEVFGEIKPQPTEFQDGTSKNAFKSITVNAVYMNNYLLTKAATSRYMTPGNGTNDFDQATTPLKAQMMDEIAEGNQADFKTGAKAAAYQLFPLTEAENAVELANLPKEFFDHVILKVHIEYDPAVVPQGHPTTEDGYITIVRFMETATTDLKGFQAGYIYKLDLNELSKDFKTNEDGTPDTPVTPDPEPAKKKQLKVLIKPYEWKAKNIKPDVEGGGYKGI